MILAPLRGVTIRCFRESFAEALDEYGFTEAVTPFITANAGVDPLKDRELRGVSPSESALKITPQFIGKDPVALKYCLERIKGVGLKTADLNCGCPFPMVRNKFRGSGILKTRDVFEKMIATGCEVMGEGAFSIKVRLGVEKSDEFLSLVSIVNSYPLRYLTVHARTAKQMYEGECDIAAFKAIADAVKVPLVYNGDAFLESGAIRGPNGAEDLSKFNLHDVMIGRGFIKSLAFRDDIGELLERYIDSSVKELGSPRPVLGRMKELLAYWKDFSHWTRVWKSAKMAKTLDEFKMCLI